MGGQFQDIVDALRRNRRARAWSHIAIRSLNCGGAVEHFER
jgi:hypothetical protein